MYTILFVDDQPEILNALRRALMQEPDDWEIHVATGGHEALHMMEGISYDIIITDIKMPDMDGLDLLESVADTYPSTLRFILSGYTERDLMYKSVGNVHQFLSKPLDTKHLIETIRKTIKLQERPLPPHIRTLVSGLKGLPSFPQYYNELVEALCTASVSLTEVSEIIQKDVALTARMMHVVNSSFFGNPVYVSRPAHAVSLLGTEILKGLVFSSYAFSIYEESTSELFSIQDFENHSLHVAALARKIAEEENASQFVIDDAYVAGLLHDIGKLILVSCQPAIYDAVRAYARDCHTSLNEAEIHKLNTTHAEIGAYLLGIWGFRSNIVEAVLYHKKPALSQSTGFSAVTAVHVANHIVTNAVEKQRPLWSGELDKAYLDRLELSYRLSFWQSLSFKQFETERDYDNQDSIC